MQEMTLTRDGGASPHASSADITLDEIALRRDLAAAYRLAALFHWDDMVGTHFTVRLPHQPGQPEAFLINPFGMLFEEITASSLVKVDVEGNILSDGDYPVNKAGFVVHSAIHQKRADAACVLHIHTDDGVAVSSLEDGLLPLNQVALIIRGKIAVHEYEGPATSLDERERLAADLGDRDFMFLRNHGTMTVGPSVAEAFHNMYLLEKACRWQVRTLSMNVAWHRPDEQIIAEVDRDWGHRNANSAHYAERIVWPALLRKLDRICPEYKD